MGYKKMERKRGVKMNKECVSCIKRKTPYCPNYRNRMMLLKENKQLEEELEYTIGIVEHNRIISEKNKEIHQLKDNWNKLKDYIRENIIYDDVGMKILDTSPLEDYMQELEQESDE